MHARLSLDRCYKSLPNIVRQTVSHPQAVRSPITRSNETFIPVEERGRNDLQLDHALGAWTKSLCTVVLRCLC